MFQDQSRPFCNRLSARPILLLDASLVAFNNDTKPVEVLHACNATTKTLQADAGPPLLLSTLSTILFSPFDPFFFFFLSCALGKRFGNILSSILVAFQWTIPLYWVSILTQVSRDTQGMLYLSRKVVAGSTALG